MVRSTLTVIVFCIFVETTTPSRTFLFEVSISSSACCFNFIFAQNRHDACTIFPFCANQVGFFHLARDFHLIAKLKQLFREILIECLQIFCRLFSQLICFCHYYTYTLSTRSTNRVFRPSFAAARLRALCAISLGTPPTSNKIRPGRTTATQ